MKRRAICFIIIVSLMASLAACKQSGDARKKIEGTKYLIYYLDNNNFYTEDYYSTTTNASDLVKELLSGMGLMEDTKDGSSLHVTNSNIANGVAYVYFNDAYRELDNVYEVLFRTSVVKTLTQLTDVNSVYFYVNNKPLTYADGSIVGQMQEDDFITGSDNELNNMARAEITLYWGNADGTGLKESHIDVAYVKTVRLEKLIIEQLIQGPDEDGYTSVLPQDMEIINVTVRDRTCYVNLDNKFTEGVNGIPFEVSLYSIVNSLCELDYISKVQFQVNGDSRINVGATSLNQFYEKNYDIIEQEVLP